jgi:ankyrin repeat protein
MWSFSVIAAVARATDGSRGSQHQTPSVARHQTPALRPDDHQPNQLALAAEKDSLDAVGLLIELGSDVNAGHWRAPLHEAAMRGNLAVIRLLLEHGADPSLRDPGYHATPRGWAEHHGMTEAEAYLAPLTEER